MQKLLGIKQIGGNPRANQNKIQLFKAALIVDQRERPSKLPKPQRFCMSEKELTQNKHGNNSRSLLSQQQRNP